MTFSFQTERLTHGMNAEKLFRMAVERGRQKGYLHKENMDRLKRAEELAKRYSTDVGDIALRYIFSNRMDLFAIVSTENPKRFLSNIRSASSPLTPEETEWLETGSR